MPDDESVRGLDRPVTLGNHGPLEPLHMAYGKAGPFADLIYAGAGAQQLLDVLGAILARLLGDGPTRSRFPDRGP